MSNLGLVYSREESLISAIRGQWLTTALVNPQVLISKPLVYNNLRHRWAAITWTVVLYGHFWELMLIPRPNKATERNHYPSRQYHNSGVLLWYGGSHFFIQSKGQFCAQVIGQDGKWGLLFFPLGITAAWALLSTNQLVSVYFLPHSTGAIQLITGWLWANSVMRPWKGNKRQLCS